MYPSLLFPKQLRCIISILYSIHCSDGIEDGDDDMKLQHPDATELWIQSLGDKVANDHAWVFEDDEF